MFLQDCNLLAIYLEGCARVVCAFPVAIPLLFPSTMVMVTCSLLSPSLFWANYSLRLRVAHHLDRSVYLRVPHVVRHIATCCPAYIYILVFRQYMYFIRCVYTYFCFRMGARPNHRWLGSCLTMPGLVLSEVLAQ